MIVCWLREKNLESFISQCLKTFDIASAQTISQMERKYSQYIYQTNNFYAKYVRNFYKTIPIKENPIKNGETQIYCIKDLQMPMNIY